MKILNAKIEEFGCFVDRSFDFSDRFNLITGANESGKSTLLSFIKFIFYGLPRKNQDTQAERDRSISKKGSRAAGRITVELDSGERYIIERKGILRSGEKRESYSEECRIIDAKSATQVHKGENPGELFFGVPATVFESTCFVRQMKATEMNDDVGDALSNMLLSADESLDLQRSLDRLDAARKTLLHKTGHGGSLAVLSDSINDLRVRLDRARSDRTKIIKYSESASELRKSAMAKREELDRLDDTFTAFNSVSVIKRFDILNARKKKLVGLRAELEEYKNKNRSESGYLPGRDFIYSSSEALRAYREAGDACSATFEKLKNAELAVKNQKKRCPEFTASQIREAGGVEKICHEIDCTSSEAAKKKSLSIGMIIFALIAVLVGAVAAALLPGLLFVGAGLCGIALALLIAGICFFNRSKKLAAIAMESFEKWNIPFSEGTGALRRYLTYSFDDEALAQELRRAQTLAASAYELRSADLDSAEASVSAILSKWSADNVGDLKQRLIKTIEKAKEISAECDRLEREISSAERTVSDLSSELSGYNEKDLRARVPREIIDGYSEDALSELERRRRFVSSALKSVSESQIESERELVRLESESENPTRLALELEETQRKYDAEKLRYDAIITAYNALSSAGTNIRDSVTPVIRKKAGEYLSALTSGRYTSLGISDGCVAASVENDGDISQINTLSAGTRDAAYLSLRLSLIELLFSGETPPLALDEALCQLDDTRATEALRMIERFCMSGGQCLLFTCHERESLLLGNTESVRKIAL